MRLISLVFALALAHPCAKALNPDRKISQYAHSAWRLKDGFFGGAPNTITQTKDGYIWIGTTSGVVRFDGVRFVPWNPPNAERLRTAKISTVLGTSDGSLWIAEYTGNLWQWHDQTITTYLPSRIASVSKVVEGRAGTVWVSRIDQEDRAGTICEVGNGQTHCFLHPDELPSHCCYALARDRAGDIWFGGGGGFGRWSPGSSKKESFPIVGNVMSASEVQAFTFPSDQPAWVAVDMAGRGLGLERLAHGTLSPLKLGKWDSSRIDPVALLQDRHNALWVATQSSGIYRIESGRVEHFGTADGLSSDRAVNLLEDREGNIWVATDGGLDCFRDLAVISVSRREGLRTTGADTVLATRDGAIWAGGVEALDTIRKDKISSLQTGKGLNGYQVTSLLEDHRGQLWVGVDHTLSTLKNGLLTPLRRPNGDDFGFVVGLTEDIEHNIWAEISGTPRELVRISNRQVKQILPSPQMPDARRVAADPAGGIWLGLMSGNLARYREGKLQVFQFPHESSTMVTELSVNPDGLVLGATGFGLVGWRDGNQRVLTSRNGLPCDHVNTFIQDRQEALWLYTQCGLVRIARKAFEEWWSHPDMKVGMRIFDFADGVQPGMGSFQQSARAGDGKLWFANGIVFQVIDPAALPTNEIPPVVHVEEVTLDGKTLASTNKLQLPPLTRSIAIRYTALSFVAPQKVLFRYMLEGQDNDWQDAGTRREAFYTNLAPRTYRFRVIACNNDGRWNEIGDTFSFTISPAYYQTRWFLLLCGVTVLCVVTLLYVLRLRQAHKEIEQRMEARLEERERISRELHDTLLQGFQGLMLRFQSVMKTLPAHHPSYQSLEKVLDRADEVLVEGRQSVRDLRTRGGNGEELGSLVSRCGDDLAQNQAIRFSLSVLGTSQALEPLVFDEAYSIVREALINAFQHSRSTKVEAEIIFSDSNLRLRIRDDGVGIPEAVITQGRPNHWGLSGMRERAKRINAELTVWSRAGAGTEIELQIPGKLAYSNTLKGSRWARMRRVRHGSKREDA